MWVSRWYQPCHHLDGGLHQQVRAEELPAGGGQRGLERGRRRVDRSGVGSTLDLQLKPAGGQRERLGRDGGVVRPAEVGREPGGQPADGPA